ncbi:MAG: hypothetical protein CMI54_02490 [Parcubacteria group bacterium]|jgi:hypothetical protein|nr:hypothetical protein [Parcubacteria group bacterium]|tara:strand:+ start:8396 stop:9325 length:930 start_codon:yes stop_codon:yes gene_type:complete
MLEKSIGYVKFHRSMIESEIWNKPAWWFKVWSFIIFKGFYDNGIHLKTGEFLTSYKEIYKECAFTKRDISSPEKIDNVFRFLRNENMITTRKTTRGIKVTICNYCKYQHIQNEINETQNDEKRKTVIVEMKNGNSGVTQNDTKNETEYNSNTLYDKDSEDLSNEINETQNDTKNGNSGNEKRQHGGYDRKELRIKEKRKEVNKKNSHTKPSLTNEQQIIFQNVINHYNEITGTRRSESIPLRQRIVDGKTEEDMFHILENQKWKLKDQLQFKNYNLDTLFRDSHWDDYLNPVTLETSQPSEDDWLKNMR